METIYRTRELNEKERKRVYWLAKKGKLVKRDKGVFTLPEEDIEDEMYEFQKKYSKCVYCNQTALHLWNLGDYIPVEYDVMLPNNSNVSCIKNKNGIRVHQTDKKYYELGLTVVKNNFGNEVVVYDREKTLCDIMRPNCQISKETVIRAYKDYFNSKKVNLGKLIEYAKIMKVEDKIRPYVEVLSC